MTARFHLSPIRLGPGSIIEPGNFGRMLRTHTIQEGPSVSPLIVRELVFEMVRRERFPAKPSRLSACLACPTKADMDLYVLKNNASGSQVLHEVELMDEDASCHIANTSHLEMGLPGVMILPTATMLAVEYWSSTPGRAGYGDELIVAGPLRVVRCLD